MTLFPISDLNKGMVKLKKMSGMYSSSKIVSNLSMKKKQGLDFENYKLTLHFVLMCDSMKIKVT